MGEGALHKRNSLIFAAAAVSGEREESDTGEIGENLGGASDGLGNDFKHLRFSRMFAGGHVGKEVSLALAVHNGKPRESGCSETEGIATS